MITNPVGAPPVGIPVTWNLTLSPLATVALALFTVPVPVVAPKAIVTAELRKEWACVTLYTSTVVFPLAPPAAFTLPDAVTNW